MWYLVTQYWFWLLLAFVLGLLVGWMTWGGPRRGWGWLPLGALAAVAIGLVSWFRMVNGLPALWLETGILLFAGYIAGCWLGSYLRAGMAPGLAAPVAAQAVVKSAMAVPVLAPAPMSAPAAVAVPVPAPAVTPQTAARVMSGTEPAPAARIIDEDSHAGKRPPGLAAPRGGKADDLKRISGIGRQNEGRLHGLGIWHFKQVAAWTKPNVEWMGSYLAFPGRIDREGWVSQASELASGQETTPARRARTGLVATSRDDGSLGQGNVEGLDLSGRPKPALSKKDSIAGKAPARSKPKNT